MIYDWYSGSDTPSLFRHGGGALGGVAVNAEDEGAFTIQVQSISKILGDARDVVREVAGEDAVKEMDKAIKEGLGRRASAASTSFVHSQVACTLRGR